ncbi:ANTAR domain-containing protein [Streptomyces albicerus]|uniref:ANTAR domain-containing protein n=1 Tax=Streptomyces albicerus TaxID=2569859 RepID=UPI00124B1DB2|nr:ANTAR domain-containing protein [Streptomyces albicerus]
MTSDAGSGADEPGGGPREQPAPDENTPRIVELQEEIGQLKEAVTSHAVVDQAIGMMVALGRVTPDDGWSVLREVSQHTNIKLRNVAELIIIWGQKGDLPPDIRATLEETLDRYGPTLLPEDSPPP